MKIDGVHFDPRLSSGYTQSEFIARFWHLWPAANADVRQSKLTTAYQLLQLYAHPA